jgi:hypothetical protein
MTGDTATINRSREERVAELTDYSRRELIVAEALEAAALVLASADVPVAHYAPIWERIERRLVADAHESRLRARRANDRLDDVQAAIVARERWQQDHR